MRVAMLVSVFFQNNRRIKRLTSKLTEQRKAHANRADLSGEDLRHIQIHGSIAASTAQLLVFCGRWCKRRTELTPGKPGTGR